MADNVEVRLAALEALVASIQQKLNSFAVKMTLKQGLLLLESSVNDIARRLGELENRVLNLEQRNR